VVDCGVDLERFRGATSSRPAPGVWEGSRRSSRRSGRSTAQEPGALAEAFAELGAAASRSSATARPQLEDRRGVQLVGRVPNDEVASWLAAADVVCQPSLVEPFGQAILEALASERSVVATRVGGPPEFVSPEAGVLVDQTCVEEIAEGLRAADALPSPNQAAREAALPHDVRVQAERVERILEEAAAQ
jgi:glycosyltransferase involved in cell wall biosynthesis